MKALTKDVLIDELTALDKRAYFNIRKGKIMKLVIVGGSALILLDLVKRVTDYIDAIESSHELQEFLADYDINTKVLSYENCFPYNYCDRIVKLFSGMCIDFYTLSLEDLVIAKLYSARPKDKEDIIDQAVINAINWDLLEKLALSDDEAKASSLNEFRYKEFVDNYKDYVEMFKK